MGFTLDWETLRERDEGLGEAGETMERVRARMSNEDAALVEDLLRQLVMEDTPPPFFALLLSGRPVRIKKNGQVIIGQQSHFIVRAETAAEAAQQTCDAYRAWNLDDLGRALRPWCPLERGSGYSVAEIIVLRENGQWLGDIESARELAGKMGTRTDYLSVSYNSVQGDFEALREGTCANPAEHARGCECRTLGEE